VRIVLVRHGETEWSATGKHTSRTDVPLTDAGVTAARRLGERLAGREFALVLTSPRRRARETAALLLGAPVAETDHRLVEMDWGHWEGCTLAELRAAPGTAEREAAGLDFRPEGGETPREVQERVLGFLRDCAAAAPSVAVTHKGVIRAVLALATGWTMREKPPVRLRWDALHRFALDAEGRPRVERLNIGLAHRP
jgi:probable phosphoglycerate mutase